MNFSKKVFTQKNQKVRKRWKQLFDPPEKIVVEIMSGSKRPAVPQALHGLQAQRASMPAGPPGLEGLQAQRGSRSEGPPVPNSLQTRKAFMPEQPPDPKGLLAILLFKLAFCHFSLRFAILAHILLF